MNFIYNRLFHCNHTWYCDGTMAVSLYVTSASRYQRSSSMYIRGLIPRNSSELAEAVLIETNTWP